LGLRERIATWPLVLLMIVLGLVPALAIQYFTAPVAAIVAIVEGVGA
jgi:NADH-quinone oxidoreductase subunit M